MKKISTLLMLMAITVSFSNAQLNNHETLTNGGQDAAMNTINNMDGPSVTVLTPDDKFLYVISNQSDAINVFSRNTTNGVLTLEEEYVNGGLDAASNTINEMNFPYGLAISPDGNFIYVTGLLDNALNVFSRNTTTGELTLVADYLDGGQDEGMNIIDGLSTPTLLTVSPDNKHVYVSANGDNSIAVFSRNIGDGKLTYVELLKDGATDAMANPLTKLRGTKPIVSPDNNHVYVASSVEDAVTVFSRNTTTGVLTLVEELVDGGQDAAMNALTGLDAAYEARVSPDNNQVYVVGTVDDAITVFDRNTTTGVLTFVEMHTDDGTKALNGASNVIITTERVYVMGSAESAVQVFDRNVGDGTLTALQKFNVGASLSSVAEMSITSDLAYLYIPATSSDALVSAIESSQVPVEFTSFSATMTTEGTQLYWQTSSELNNAGFEVEHSTDGKSWQMLDFVEGAGTTLEVQYYNYLHQSPANGINYYRLRQVDIDGVFDYSDIVTATFIKPNEIALNTYPNPTTNTLNIVGGQGQATLYTMLGKPVRSYLITNESYQIPVKELPNGYYFLQIIRNDGTIVKQQFIKQ